MTIAVAGTSASGGHFTEILRSGVVLAEQFVPGRGTGSATSVEPAGSPTLLREPGSSCWRALPKGSAEALSDVGHPFVAFLEGQKVTTHATKSGWTISFTATGDTATVVTVGKDLLVSRITLTQSDENALELVSNLSRAPKLLVPKPRCKD